MVIGMQVLPIRQGLLEKALKGNVNILVYLDANTAKLAPLIKMLLDNA